MLLRRATLADGRTADLRIDADCVLAVGDLVPLVGEDVVELTGWLVLPAPAEPHAHLDKALTADLAPNPTGDLLGAIEAWLALQPTLGVDDIAARAEQAARRLMTNGCTAIRSHVNAGAGLGMRAVEALVQTREALGDDVDLELVALVGELTGDHGAENRAVMRASLAAGVDLVGGCPHLEADPHGCVDWCLDLAGELERPVDLHMDETLNPTMLLLPHLCERIVSTGFEHGVTASHCVSLGMQDEHVQRSIAEQCADVGVAVVVLPQTNLFLQGRGHRVATPRGLTALRPLLTAGATLAAGADNIQDPFNTMGRGDPMETASLLVMAGHLLPDEAYLAISRGSRRALHRPSAAGTTVAAGDPAELLAIASPTLRAAIADAPPGRMVVHRGRFVVNGPTGQPDETEASQSSHGARQVAGLGSPGS
jgi:cytosine/creatinine deaminase